MSEAVGEDEGEKIGEHMEEKEDRSDSYYQHWLAALEHLAIAKGLSEAGELALRVHAWREAYLATPHGQPVELSRPRGWCEHCSEGELTACQIRHTLCRGI